MKRILLGLILGALLGGGGVIASDLEDTIREIAEEVVDKHDRDSSAHDLWGVPCCEEGQ